MTDTLPPKPPDLAARIIGDAEAHVRVPREALASRVATAIRNSDITDAMIEGEEIAAAIVDAHWSDDELMSSYTHALEQVRVEYMRQAELITTVLDDLEAGGRESWIARALRNRFASEVTWEALDRLGELTLIPDEALCESCGAAFSRLDEGRGAS